MPVNKDIENIIRKNLEQTSNEEEDQRLQDWRDEDDFNDQEFLRLRQAWKQERLQDDGGPDNDKWDNFKRQYFRNSKPTRLLRGSSLLKYSLIAVLFIASITAAIYYSGSEVYRNKDGERKSIQLRDGSEIVLRENSSLTVGRIFNGFTRDVNLRGSAIFRIKDSSDKKFTALGSKSIASARSGIWFFTASESMNRIQVFEGEASFWRIGTSDTIQIRAGETGYVENNQLHRDSLSDSNPAWLSGRFVFDQTPLIEALTFIQDHYQLSLYVDPGVSLIGCRINGNYDQLQLKEILEKISKQVGMHYTVEQQTLKIQKAECGSP